MTTTLERLPFTGDDAADRLLVTDPLALLIGFELDQQVTVQKAFSGPVELQRRIGHLDAARIAAMDPAELVEVFRTPPALHRFPAAMAARVQELTPGDRRPVRQRRQPRLVGGDLGQGPRGAPGGLPGFGPMKPRTVLAIVVKRFGVRPPGWEAVLPTHPTLADVDSPESLAAYQAGKRAKKAEMRAAKAAKG